MFPLGMAKFCFVFSLKKGSINLGVLFAVLGVIGMGLFGWSIEAKKWESGITYWGGLVVIKSPSYWEDNQADVLFIVIILFLFAISQVVIGFCLLFGAIQERPELLLPSLIMIPLNLTWEVIWRIFFLSLTNNWKMNHWSILTILAILSIFPYFWYCVFCFWKKMKKAKEEVNDYTI